LVTTEADAKVPRSVVPDELEVNLKSTVASPTTVSEESFVVTEKVAQVVSALSLLHRFSTPEDGTGFENVKVIELTLLVLPVAAVWLVVVEDCPLSVSLDELLLADTTCDREAAAPPPASHPVISTTRIPVVAWNEPATNRKGAFPNVFREPIATPPIF
jgi:hypothetical protein